MPKFGESRESDGRVFRGMQTCNGKTYEQWVTPATLAKRKAAQLVWQRNKRAMDPAHRAKTNEYSRVYVAAARRRDPVGYWLTTTRCRAKALGLEFNLTRENFPAMPTHCPVLGLELIYTAPGRSAPNSASLDRRDNTRGYMHDNVLVVSRRANVLKSDATPRELALLAAFYSEKEI